MIEVLKLRELPADVTYWWDQALRRNSKLTPFHSYNWMLHWAVEYGELDRALVVIDRDRYSTRSLLCLREAEGELRTLPHNATDYTGPVYDEARPDLRALVEWLRRCATHQQVRLWNLADADPLLQLLDSLGAAERVGITPTMATDLRGQTYRSVPGTQAISASQVARKRRRLLRRGARVDLSVGRGLQDIQSMIALHSKRWTARGNEGNFGDHRRALFVSALSKDPDLTFAVATMFLSGEMVAYRFGPTKERTYYDWNTGFDPDWSRFSPGIVLLDEATRLLRSQAGFERIDFLRGEEPYKLAWATEHGCVHEIMVRQ